MKHDLNPESAARSDGFDDGYRQGWNEALEYTLKLIREVHDKIGAKAVVK